MTVEINNESGVEVDELRVQKLAVFLLDKLYIHSQSELAILFVDESAIESLHIQWLDEPGPTDVLSFPMDELRPGDEDTQSDPGLLGDVVVCPQIAQIQGQSAGHGRESEILLLVTHGILHLLGFDHATQEQEREMFSLQKSLLSDFAEHESMRTLP